MQFGDIKIGSFQLPINMILEIRDLSEEPGPGWRGTNWTDWMFVSDLGLILIKLFDMNKI